ncbi:SH3 domain-containing protein [Leptospira ilyithenensis]|uniref:SH3 domain-containing protein n=1 Tax=Leptospira ilyithenensis TaxID=2484901 RepID=A0A4R9LUD4_9LEPT|nr:SH3 domain-containing protein [Leptospira ilyithenensis]TGN11737.1 SH3 domain-containing protein [Leptospira ilyithenensis]
MKPIRNYFFILVLLSGVLSEGKAVSPRYAKNEILYSHVLSSLRMRKEPSEKSEVIASISYGEKLKLLETTGKSGKFSGIQGNWIKAESGTNTGYVFDGFLSRLRTPSDSDENSVFTYAKSVGASIGKTSSKDGSSSTKIGFKNSTPEEIFLILKGLEKRYISPLSLPDEKSFTKVPEENAESSEVTLKLTRDKDGYAKSILIDIVWVESSGSEVFLIEKKSDQVSLTVTLNEP